MSDDVSVWHGTLTFVCMMKTRRSLSRSLAFVVVHMIAAESTHLCDQLLWQAFGQ